ncbi:MAG: L-serine ammonia-lyase, iron-sulfur-dependent, subunit alpha [Selenomonadaceae bacterium]
MINFKSVKDLVDLGESKNVVISELIIAYEMESTQFSREDVLRKMKNNWQVMQEAALRGIANEEKSVSGLVGGDARRLAGYGDYGYTGAVVMKATAYAVGISEVNAIMGRIVACPTAGSCGILPAAILAAAEKNKNTEDEILAALFTAAGIGMIIDQNASISGAEGGCQAECGSAAGMAAAALVVLKGGTSKQICDGAALAIKNMLGLVCDPVAGLVEVPCVKRNGFAVVQAMVAADMAMAGVRSVIPIDEVIEAMKNIGAALPKSLRETSEGGLAATSTAQSIEQKLYGHKSI